MSFEVTRRAAGWKYELPGSRTPSRGESNLLIRHCDQGLPFLDPPTIRKYIAKIKAFSASELTSLLNVLPSIETLVVSVPWTLPVIEALYVRCEQLHFFNSGSLMPCLLKAEELFCRVVWWIAYREQGEKSGKAHARTLPSVESLEKSLSSILGVISRQFPILLTRASADKRQLEICLESLGCHGLVNSSQGLIRIQDAMKIEIAKHDEKLKKCVQILKETTEKSENSIDPSSASHQRQIGLRLSEIFDRLKHNEQMEKLLTDTTSNQHLCSLLRIARKRVASDRLLVGLFNAFHRAIPSDFKIEHLDPVIAELIVVFNNTYEKVFQLANYQDFDSGCSNESGSEPGTTSTPSKHHHESSSLGTLGLRSITINTPEINADEQEAENEDKREMRRANQNYPNPSEHKKHQNPNIRYNLGKQSDQHNDDTLRLRLHIEHLKNELANARNQVEHLMRTKSDRPVERLWPEPDYPEATSYYNCSSQEDVRGLTRRFSNLFDKDRDELMATLDKLPEFRGSDELQLKTILSVAVLTYRSVLDSVQKRLAKIFEIIEEGETKNENEEANMLEVALYRHMYRRAKSQHGMSNAKEVTTQIWNTLYDFPSLKTCTRFNRFILECVDVCWDLVAGIDGRYPRLRIDFEAPSHFDSEKHTRFEGSEPLKTQIRSVLWPGLFDQNTHQILLKMVVLT
ncbi:unnamed protein product, partial [Mesorhabditis belari]|uniref:Mitochondria-eating protein n=1 Tax=Mesorhabditis belari TaxID=2138241 RepID=A0AAF3FDT6_9BILA